jgi:hypothetical protein
MGRPSKLTPAQWAEVERRLLAGETARSLAPKYGLSEAALRKKFGANQSVSSRSARVQSAARLVADANDAIEALPPMQRQVALTLADELRAISRSLATAARLGSETAEALARKANEQAATVEDENGLRAVAMLTRTANEAAATGLALLRANEDTLLKEEAERQRQAEKVTRIEIVAMAPQGPATE